MYWRYRYVEEFVITDLNGNTELLQDVMLSRMEGFISQLQKEKADPELLEYGEDLVARAVRDLDSRIPVTISSDCRRIFLSEIEAILADFRRSVSERARRRSASYEFHIARAQKFITDHSWITDDSELEEAQLECILNRFFKAEAKHYNLDDRNHYRRDVETLYFECRDAIWSKLDKLATMDTPSWLGTRNRPSHTGPFGRSCCIAQSVRLGRMGSVEDIYLV